jgi:hypothetical protein
MICDSLSSLPLTHRTRIVGRVGFNRVDAEDPMASTPDQTIKDAVEAYLAGSWDQGTNHAGEYREKFRDLLDSPQDFRGLGSEYNEIWPDKGPAPNTLKPELNQRRADDAAGRRPVGDLVSCAEDASPVHVSASDDMAWFQCSGDVTIGATSRCYPQASWSAVLVKEKEQDAWKIVFSHFSIHDNHPGLGNQP